MILIVTEGEKTEREYLHAVHKDLGTGQYVLRIVEAGVPSSCVDEALRLRNDPELPAPEQVWCVFDVDAHPRVDDSVDRCSECNIRVAVSNPCIELWLLLHHQNFGQSKHRHTVQRLLREHTPDSDKDVDYRRHYRGKVPEAMRRADRLMEVAEVSDPKRPHQKNPSTGMMRLLRAILPSTAFED